MTTTDATFRKEIKFDRENRDFACYLDGDFKGYAATYSEGETLLDRIAYDLLKDGAALTATELDGGSDVDTMAEEVAAAVAVVVPNPGIHLNQYTVVLSQHDQAFCYEIKTLCDACRATTPNASKMGEVINGCCDACGTGPSVSHFRLEVAPEPPSSLCPDCQGSGWVPNGFGTGDQAGGWADTCACQDRRDLPVDGLPPPPWERPAARPLSDAAELAAEISAVDGLPLAEARQVAQTHLQHVTHAAGTVCTNCGTYGHAAIDCPYEPLPLPRPRPRRPSPYPIAADALLAEADRVMAEVSYAAERLGVLVAA